MIEPILIKPEEIKNYYKSIAEHKEISKIVMMLTSAVNSFRQDILDALHEYSEYHFLWEDDRDKVVKVELFSY